MNRQCGALTIVLGLMNPVGTRAQSDQMIANAFDVGRDRIVYSSASIDQSDIERVARGLAFARGTLVGFPKTVVFSRKLTVSLVVNDVNAEADAWSWPSEGVIGLSAKRVAAWDDAKLRRVLAHEVAHVRLTEFLGDRAIPYWFSEGFAEWAAGGRACERAWIIWTDMRRRHVSDMQLPRLNGMLANGSPDRIEYDYLFDVVEFMDERWPGVVSTGELVTHVRDMGWSTATRKVVGRSCLLYTSPSPRDATLSRMPSSA